MSYYPEPDNHNATKKELKHATDIDTSHLPAKRDFIVLIAQVDKLHINILTNVPTSLNDLKTKIYNLDIGELKTVPADSKKLTDVEHNEAVKNTTFNPLKTKVNYLDKNIPDATTLIRIN